MFLAFAYLDYRERGVVDSEISPEILKFEERRDHFLFLLSLHAKKVKRIKNRVRSKTYTYI